MYKCEICGVSLRPTDPGIAIKILGWSAAKNGLAGSVPFKYEGPLGYAHKICLDTKEAGEMPTLF